MRKEGYNWTYSWNYTAITYYYIGVLCRFAFRWTFLSRAETWLSTFRSGWVPVNKVACGFWPDANACYDQASCSQPSACETEL